MKRVSIMAAGMMALALLTLVGSASATPAGRGAWVLERIAYFDDLGKDPNYPNTSGFHINNPEQSGGRGGVEASYFYGGQSKFKVAYGWSDPPGVISPGAKLQVPLSVTLLENDNRGHYEMRAEALVSVHGDVYPDRTGLTGGRNLADAQGNRSVGVTSHDALGTRRAVTFQGDGPGVGSEGGPHFTIRVALTTGYNPIYYYIYRWAPDGRPVHVVIDKGAIGQTSGPTPSPVTAARVEKFNNYNSNVECRYTDRASFSIREPLGQVRAALWYDFGGVGQSVTYSLAASGQTIGHGAVRKGDCAAGYTWCHGFVDLGDLAAGSYTLAASPARICHNPSHDNGNGFVMVSGVPKR
jgi:hypothetical protein